jgi:hypothetical protein
LQLDSLRGLDAGHLGVRRFQVDLHDTRDRHGRQLGGFWYCSIRIGQGWLAGHEHHGGQDREATHGQRAAQIARGRDGIGRD